MKQFIVTLTDEQFEDLRRELIYCEAINPKDDLSPSDLLESALICNVLKVEEVEDDQTRN